MATDVARLSFDPGRRYTGVVPQQGRVSLEAEDNEQRVIDAEERRKELLDVIGPAGTPDDGYRVSFAGPELTVGPGTMYVGGLRAELDAKVSYAHQPDWLDGPTSLDRGLGHVVLRLRETDVTAVEDPMLFEPALGGPDGAARTRLLQHIEVLKNQQKTCSTALAQDEKGWLSEGATFDPETMKLNSNGRLLVTWEGVPEAANPCEPTSIGGYLGAENQLIRVQIADVSRDGRTFSILWGYDDASMLYRVRPDASTPPVLTLQRCPVDDFHRPRAGQAVQVLRSTAALASTDGAIEGYVAALTGEVAVLTTPYDPDTKTVQFPAALPAPYTDTTQTPQLYLRVWEELCTGNRLGKPTTLTGTGIQVTITVDGGGTPRIGDFWCIGVRPSTPTVVYPDRLVRAPQPPDGPREWVCPLAVVDIPDRKHGAVVEDCRVSFTPLTQIEEGCCTVEVHPRDAAAGKLQQILDRAVAGRGPRDRTGRVTVCFSPGHYGLPEPLVLGRQHSNVTLQACSKGAIIAAAPGREKLFGQGLFILADVDETTITGFEFQLPQVPAAAAVPAERAERHRATMGAAAARAIDKSLSNWYFSIAIRAVDCAVLDVTDCTFRFSVGEHQPSAAERAPRNVYGVGLFASGGAWGLRLRDNLFSHHPDLADQEPVAAQRLLVGYLLAPNVDEKPVPALLDAAEVVGNTFRGITTPMLVIATMGAVRIRDNVVDRCGGGFWLMDALAVANNPRGTAALLGEAFLFIAAFGETYPLPQLDSDVVDVEKDAVNTPQTNATAAQSNLAEDLIEQLRAGHGEFTVGKPSPAAKAAMVAWAAINQLQHAPISEASRAAREPGLLQTSFQTSIRVESNDIVCRTNGKQRSGPALFVFSLTLLDQPNPSSGIDHRNQTGAGTAIVSDNRMIATPAHYVCAVLGPHFATLTGNVIATVDSQSALAVLGVSEVAVTGNVIRGRALLPSRPFPAPLDTWVPLNTITG